MDKPIKVIERFFLGLANGDKFAPSDKDFANTLEESFKDDEPDEFFQAIYNDIVDNVSGANLTEGDTEEMIIEMGMITMLYIKYKIKQAGEVKNG